MNIYRLLILLAFAGTGCKKEGSEPPAEIAGIVGQWRSVESTEVRGDPILTKLIPTTQSHVITFRFDGIMLGEDGAQGCCTPTIYILNGKMIEPKPQAPVPTNGDCNRVTCLACPEYFKITQESGSELITEFCSMKIKYTKEQ